MDFGRRQKYCSICILAGLLLVGCTLTGTNTNETPGPCFATTGERDYLVTIQTRPPARVRAAEEITLRFMGGYYDVLPSCENIAGQDTYHYPTVKELQQRSRIVDIWFDEQLILSQTCTYDCIITITLPPTTRPGAHRLLVIPRSWAYVPREMVFEIEVTN